MTDWRCLDTRRIKKAVEESRSAFDSYDPLTCRFDEFQAYMDLLDFRSNLFGITGVIEHAERYAYRMNPKMLDFVIERIAANAFSMEG